MQFCSFVIHRNRSVDSKAVDSELQNEKNKEKTDGGRKTSEKKKKKTKMFDYSKSNVYNKTETKKKKRKGFHIIKGEKEGS